VAYGDVNQQIDLVRQPDIADFEIGAATTLTREHLLAPGGKTCVITNALKRLQDVLVRSGPISVVVERVLFIGTQFSILYTSMYSPA
jgi:hypothetical protein